MGVIGIDFMLGVAVLCVCLGVMIIEKAKDKRENINKEIYIDKNKEE